MRKWKIKNSKISTHLSCNLRHRPALTNLSLVNTEAGRGSLLHCSARFLCQFLCLQVTTQLFRQPKCKTLSAPSTWHRGGGQLHPPCSRFFHGTFRRAPAAVLQQLLSAPLCTGKEDGVLGGGSGPVMAR